MSERLEEFLKCVEHGESNVLHVVKEVIVAGDESAVTVELSKRRHEPQRAESQPRHHSFSTVIGFCDYIQKHANAETGLVLYDFKRNIIEAVLNDKAEKGRETVSFQPVKFPAFVMLEEMLNESMPVQAFAKLARRNRKVLGETAEEGQQFALLMQQITISSKVTAHIGQGAKCSNGVMCETEVKGRGQDNFIHLDFPESIQANVPIYVRRPCRSFEIDLTILAQGESACIIADAPELKTLMFDELTEIACEVCNRLNGKLMTAAGVLQWGEWRYNK